MRESLTDYKKVNERQLEKGGRRRRVVEAPCDLSQLDYRDTEFRRRIVAAYRVLLEYRVRSIAQSQD
jgi:hypothetical protein